MTVKFLKTLLISALIIGLSACTKKGEDTGTNDPTNPANLPDVAYIGAAPVTKVASNDPIRLVSSPILDDNDQPVANGYKFTVTADDSGVNGQPILLSVDGTTFGTDPIVVYSRDSVIEYYAKMPTKKTTDQSMPYRIIARPDKGHAIGRFYVSVVAGPVALLGEFKASKFEDFPPYNNKKDPDEHYIILGDGNTLSNIIIGPVLDAFGNAVDSATIRLTVDSGQIVSPNPSSVGLDGTASFSLQSFTGTGTIHMVADALDNNNQILTTAPGNILVVRPKLEITAGNTDFGNVFVNQVVTREFTITNTGNTISTGLVFYVGNPFTLDTTTSTCLTGIKLPAGGTCNLKVNYQGGNISGTYQAELRITGSPANISENMISTQVTANTVVSAMLVAPESALQIPEQTCGLPTDYITYVRNDGDLPGLNFAATTPVRQSNGQPLDTQIILPPADANPSSDPEAIINCGTTVPPRRKCRVIVRHTPQSLYSVQVLNGSVSIDGQAPLTLTIRISSKVGQPFGPLPMTITRVGSSTPITSMELTNSDQAAVKIGPVVDACNNILTGVTLNPLVTGGTILPATLDTSLGYATFTWNSTSDIAKVGPQQVTVSSPTTQGTRTVNFNGIKLVGIGEMAIGQILRLNTPVKYFYYKIKNEGVIPANNLTVQLDTAAGQWMTWDTTYQGGCHDNKLLVGEECDYRFRLIPEGTSAGGLGGVITIASVEAGQNQVLISPTATSVPVPVLSFGTTNLNMGNFPAGARPQQVLTVTNTSVNAVVNNLQLQVPSPFTLLSTDCSTQLAPSASCTATVQLPVDAKGNYSALVTATGEVDQSKASLNLSATIVANVASGTIPLSISPTSIPTNPASVITVTGGPIKDAYNNNVVAGTTVNLVANFGLMSIDNDNDGVATITTGSGVNEGKFTFTIRAKNVAEITPFTINAYVQDGATTLASGSVGGAFTGAKLEFTTSSVDFGSVAVGALDFQTVVLKNNGNETATNIGWNSSSSDFTLAGQNSCTSLAPGAQCSVTVIVSPVQVGTLSGIISVNASGNGVLSTTMPLSAVAVQAAKIVAGIPGTYDGSEGVWSYSTANLNFNYIPGSTSSIQFEVRNIGQENLVDFSRTISTRPTELGTSSLASCVTLGYNQTCLITLTFNPTATVPQTISGNLLLTGESPSRLTNFTLPFTITSPQLIFSLKDSTAPRNSCTPFRVQLQNASEVGVPVGSAVTYNLTRTGGTGTFYSNAGCSSSITSVQIPSGQSESNIFYYRGTTDGDHTLTVSNTQKSVQTLVSIYTSPVISPNAVTLAPNATQVFSTSNGLPPFTYEVVTVNGGTISGTTYTAPQAAGTYVVRSRDRLGQTSDATVTVMAVQLTAGRNFMCYKSVESGSDRVYCLGDNAFNQYGVGLNNRKGHFNESIPVMTWQSINYSALGGVKEIYGGSYNLCAINNSNRLYCQGFNETGTTGTGTYSAVTTMTPVSNPSTFTVLAGDNTVSLKWGQHACAINASNSMYCWGKNDRGQVAKANTTLYYANIQLVNHFSDFTQVATGNNFTCGLRSTGNVVCWGDNTYGQLGDATTTPRINGDYTTVVTPGAGSTPLSNIKEISAGRNHMCAVANSGNLYCWGRNDFGQVGNGNQINQPRAIQLLASGVNKVSAGGYHTCLMMTTNNEVRCWGKNTYGQLGRGNIASPALTPVANIATGTISELSLGDNYSCFVRNGSTVQCAGDNSYGIMGKLQVTAATDNTTFATVAPSSGTPTCGLSGMSYNASMNTCSCDASSNLYSFENRACTAANFTETGTVMNTAPTPNYGFTNTSTWNLGYALKTAAILHSNVPVAYSHTGLGTKNYTKIITDSDTPAGLTNVYSIGNDATSQVVVSIGSLSKTMNFRLYQNSCQNYWNLYPDLTSGGGFSIISSGMTLYSGWCYFVNASTAYTYTNVTDYNRPHMLATPTFNSSWNPAANCPVNTNPVLLQGTVSDGVTSCGFTASDLVRTGNVINSSICLDPLPTGAKTVVINWFCQ